MVWFPTLQCCLPTLLLRIELFFHFRRACLSGALILELYILLLEATKLGILGLFLIYLNAWTSYMRVLLFLVVPIPPDRPDTCRTFIWCWWLNATLFNHVLSNPLLALSKSWICSGDYFFCDGSTIYMSMDFVFSWEHSAHKETFLRAHCRGRQDPCPFFFFLIVRTHVLGQRCGA